MNVRLHAHEADRLASLASYHVLDTAPNDAFDALTRLAAAVCQAPTAIIGLLDDDRQWFLSRYGTDVSELPRAESVCSDTVAAGERQVVPNLTKDARYATLSWVCGPPSYAAYAGVPLIGRDGLPLGALCVLDTTPRAFTPAQLSALDDLAHQVVTVLELRRADASSGLTSVALVPEATQAATLRAALDNGEFVPYFQPLLDMRDGSITGLETLVRWRHPTRGLLPPEAFLPGLEAGILGGWVGRAMVEAACRLIVDLKARGLLLRDGVSVNLSGRQLIRSGPAARIVARLKRHGLPGSVLNVEITESTEVGDLGLALRELATLRDYGIRIVIDDFGVGWSNLTRLLELPLDGLKIDRELVTGMVGDPVREHMVAAAVALAATMGLDIVAEGVETKAVRDKLLEMGCYKGQGWLFSEAVPAAEVPGLMAQPARSLPTPPARPEQLPHLPAGAAPSRPDNVSGPVVGFSAAVLDALPDATAVLDKTGTIIAVNRAWRMFAVDNGGTPETTGVGVSYVDVCARAAAHGSADAAEVLAGLTAVLAGDTVESDREYPCPSPKAERWFTLRMTPIAGPSGGAVASHANITRRAASERELAHQASHDSLTGLANRLMFTEALTQALVRRPGDSGDPDVGLLYVDLCDFRAINGTYGHDAGDEVLLTTAHRLRSVLRPRDTVARLRADEFAVCAPYLTPAALAALAERISGVLDGAHRVHGREVRVSARVGTYLASAGHPPAEALRAADQAVDQAGQNARLYAECCPEPAPPGWQPDPRRSAAEASTAHRVGPQGAQEVGPPEVGPVRLAEVELAVGALPQQEPREPLFAAGADDEVGVGLPAGVEVLGDVIDVED